MDPSSDRLEEEFGDYIVMLDGPVLETFYGPTAQSTRRHLKQLWVGWSSSRKGDVIHMEIGSKKFTTTDPDRDRVEIPTADKERANALITAALARRQALYPEMG